MSGRITIYATALNSLVPTNDPNRARQVMICQNAIDPSAGDDTEFRIGGHDGVCVARSSDGTLRLWPQATGLRFAAELPLNETTRKLGKMIEAGYNGSSAGFSGKARVETLDGGQRVMLYRSVHHVRDVCLCSGGANPWSHATVVWPWEPKPDFSNWGQHHVVRTPDPEVAAAAERVFHLHYALVAVQGHQADIRNALRQLETLDSQLERLYADRAGLSLVVVRKHLAGPDGDGTGLSPEDAKRFGYVDRIINARKSRRSYQRTTRAERNERLCRHH